MSERGNSFSSFLLGTLFGGVIGGIIGVVVTTRLTQETNDDGLMLGDRKDKKGLALSTEEGMEVARRGLEDKIAQLNNAIDDVRHQLGNVNGYPERETPPSATRRES